jgi:hypothetical protein
MNVSMVFALILTIIVIGMLLVFGMGQIGNVFCLSSDAQTAKALKDLETVTLDVYNLAEGSSRLFTLQLPGDAVFCFVDPENPGTQLWPSQVSWKNWVSDPVFEEIISDKNFNLWYRHCSGQSGHTIAYLRPDSNFCAPPNTELYLENKGLWVEVSA